MSEALNEAEFPPKYEADNKDANTEAFTLLSQEELEQSSEELYTLPEPRIRNDLPETPTKVESSESQKSINPSKTASGPLTPTSSNKPKGTKSKHVTKASNHVSNSKASAGTKVKADGSVAKNTSKLKSTKTKSKESAAAYSSLRSGRLHGTAAEGAAKTKVQLPKARNSNNVAKSYSSGFASQNRKAGGSPQRNSSPRPKSPVQRNHPKATTSLEKPKCGSYLRIHGKTTAQRAKRVPLAGDKVLCQTDSLQCKTAASGNSDTAFESSLRSRSPPGVRHSKTILKTGGSNSDNIPKGTCQKAVTFEPVVHCSDLDINTSSYDCSGMDITYSAMDNSYSTWDLGDLINHALTVENTEFTNDFTTIHGTQAFSMCELNKPISTNLVLENAEASNDCPGIAQGTTDDTYTTCKSKEIADNDITVESNEVTNSCSNVIVDSYHGSYLNEPINTDLRAEIGEFSNDCSSGGKIQATIDDRHSTLEFNEQTNYILTEDNVEFSNDFSGIGIRQSAILTIDDDFSGIGIRQSAILTIDDDLTWEQHETINQCSITENDGIANDCSGIDQMQVTINDSYLREKLDETINNDLTLETIESTNNYSNIQLNELTNNVLTLEGNANDCFRINITQPTTDPIMEIFNPTNQALAMENTGGTNDYSENELYEFENREIIQTSSNDSAIETIKELAYGCTLEMAGPTGLCKSEDPTSSYNKADFVEFFDRSQPHTPATSTYFTTPNSPLLQTNSSEQQKVDQHFTTISSEQRLPEATGGDYEQQYLFQTSPSLPNVHMYGDDVSTVKIEILADPQSTINSENLVTPCSTLHPEIPHNQLSTINTDRSATPNYTVKKEIVDTPPSKINTEISANLASTVNSETIQTSPYTVNTKVLATQFCDKALPNFRINDAHFLKVTQMFMSEMESKVQTFFAVYRDNITPDITQVLKHECENIFENEANTIHKKQPAMTQGKKFSGIITGNDSYTAKRDKITDRLYTTIQSPTKITDVSDYKFYEKLPIYIKDCNGLFGKFYCAEKKLLYSGTVSIKEIRFDLRERTSQAFDFHSFRIFQGLNININILHHLLYCLVIQFPAPENEAFCYIGKSDVLLQETLNAHFHQARNALKLLHEKTLKETRERYFKQLTRLLQNIYHSKYKPQDFYNNAAKFVYENELPTEAINYAIALAFVNNYPMKLYLVDHDLSVKKLDVLKIGWIEKLKSKFFGFNE